MSFHLSAENINVDGPWLRARLRREDGSFNDAQFNLDDVLGNIDGMFQWGEQGWSQSAEAVRFSIEGGSSVPVLRAELRAVDGSYHPRDVNLAERIENINGEFRFVD